MKTNKRRELVPVSDAVVDEEELASPGALAVKRVKGWGGGMASDRKGKGPLDIGKIEELKVPCNVLPTSASVSSILPSLNSCFHPSLSPFRCAINHSFSFHPTFPDTEVVLDRVHEMYSGEQRVSQRCPGG
jgi:hypothetical protein